jgi:hypothetical protein
MSKTGVDFGAILSVVVKSETRNPKSETNPNPEEGMSETGAVFGAILRKSE